LTIRSRALPLSAGLLALALACASTGTGEAQPPSTQSPAELEARASILVAQDLRAEAARLYAQAALLRGEGDPLAFDDAIHAVTLCDTAARSCASVLLASPDSSAALLAIRAGGASICPGIVAGLDEGRFALPEYVGLLSAESLLASGDGSGALAALDAGHLPGGIEVPRADLPESVSDWSKVLRYRALLISGDLSAATALRSSLPGDSVAQSRMLHALGLWRQENGIAGWEGALVSSIRLWPSGDIHDTAWNLLRAELLSDSSMADSVADAFYSGGLWNELYELAVESETPSAHITYLAGRTRDRLGFYPEACSLLSSYLYRWPSGPDAESALLNLALDVARGGAPDSGLALMERWGAQYSASPRIGNLPWYRGSILAECGRWEQALPYFRETLSRFPSNVTADDCHFYIGLGLVELGRPAEAVQEMAAFLSSRPSSVYAPSAKYLLGCSMLRAGDRTAGERTLRELASEESGGLPGLFARQYLGIPGPAREVLDEPLESWMLRNGGAPAEPSVAARRGLVLLEAGLRKWAVAEFISAEDSAGGADMLAPLYLENRVWERMPSAGWRLAARAPSPWPREVWLLRYPAAWPDAVLRTCDQGGFDPVLVWSIMRQESMFQPWCASPAGARGLLQLIPSTSEYLAGRRGWGDYSPGLLFIPEVSLRYGVAELGDVASEAGGVIQTLSSYNGGLHNARGRWGAGSAGDDMFFCRITFDETRQYADKVYANYLVYRWLYPSFSGLVQDRFTRPFVLSCPRPLSP
jgi:soluble lytic murein transglycosylase-like protein